MTLLEMIEKWKRVKDNLMEPGLGNIRIKGDIEVADDIIKDLRSISDEPSVMQTNVRHNVLREINKAIDKGRYTDDDYIKLLSVL